MAKPKKQKMTKPQDFNITFRADDKSKKAYVIGRDICFFSKMLAYAAYPGYEIKFIEEK